MARQLPQKVSGQTRLARLVLVAASVLVIRLFTSGNAGTASPNPVGQSPSPVPQSTLSPAAPPAPQATSPSVASPNDPAKLEERVRSLESKVPLYALLSALGSGVAAAVVTHYLQSRRQNEKAKEDLVYRIAMNFTPLIVATREAHRLEREIHRLRAAGVDTKTLDAERAAAIASLAKVQKVLWADLRTALRLLPSEQSRTAYKHLRAWYEAEARADAEMRKSGVGPRTLDFGPGSELDRLQSEVLGALENQLQQRKSRRANDHKAPQAGANASID